MSWRYWGQRRRRDEELAAELASYLEHEEADQQARGATAAEARAAARRKLGNMTLVREDVYRRNSLGWLDYLAQDLRYAVRGLIKRPGFAVAVILLMILGVGLNTTMYSVIHAVLLSGLPYPQPERLVRLGHQGGLSAAARAEYDFWRHYGQAFETMAGYRGAGEQRLAWGAEGEWLQTLTVTTEFLHTLGVKPLLGREFRVEETSMGGAKAVVLSYFVWQRDFHGDPGVLGRVVTLNGTPYTVVGVLPKQFWFPQNADVLIPLQPERNSLSDNGTNTELVARLKPGVTLEQARAEMPAIVAEFHREHPEAGVLKGVRDFTAIPWQDFQVRGVRMNLWLLFGATGLLLVIACANLLTLLLTRFSHRRKEFAIRLAIGSGRGRLIAQCLIENLLPVGIGSGIGLLAAHGLLRLLVMWMPLPLPAHQPLALDSAALGFTAALAICTLVVFSLVPGLAARHLNVNTSLKEGGAAGEGRVRARTRNLLIVGEVALSTMLLIGAGLLIQTLRHLYQERLGFTTERLLTLQTPLLPNRQQSAAERANFIEDVQRKFAAVPGVEAVAVSNVVPLAGFANLPAQRFRHPEQSWSIETRSISPTYLTLLGVPLQQGRKFTEADQAGSLPVMIINETLARRWWPNGGALGDRIELGKFQGRGFGNEVAREIVGIVADTKTNLRDTPDSTAYVPLAQANGFPPATLTWVVKADRIEGLGNELREAVEAVDRTQRVRRVRSMEEVVSAATANSRFNATLFGIFASVALALVIVGVYGHLSFLGTQRRHEIGTRLALGATPQSISGLFFREGLLLTGIGLSVGAAGAFGLERLLTSLLFGVTARDLRTFATVAGLLVATALLTSWLPARRAARLNPLAVLRQE